LPAAARTFAGGGHLIGKLVLEEAMTMTYEFSEDEIVTVAEALKVYVADLRAEITRTEKHEWLEALRKEQKILSAVMAKMGCSP
jgi:hypothetical protein